MEGKIPHRWQTAASMAARFHNGQLRKDRLTPYIAHPFRVAIIVRHTFNCDDETALCAALLHDTIEDSTADYDDIAEAIGTEVADVVAALTKDMRRPNDVREDQYDSQLANAPWQARLVKLADVYDNISDCLDEKMRAKAFEKARRAIKLAGNESTLQSAVRVVEFLLR